MKISPTIDVDCSNIVKRSTASFPWQAFWRFSYDTIYKTYFVDGMAAFSQCFHKHQRWQYDIVFIRFFFFSYSALVTNPISTLLQVILPVHETSIMSLTHLKVLSVGKNIDNHTKAASVELNSTVGDQKLYDRATIDFGLVKNSDGDSDSQDNKIMLEFEIIVNDHANVTNGSKHWVGVGVRGGKRMMWIGDVALIADVPDDRRPVLQVLANCYNPVTNKSCNDDASLARR